MKAWNERTFAIVDVETTGTSATHGRIIEIGIVRVEGGKVVETYQSLVDPQTGVPEWITALTGISSEDLQTAPTFEDIAPTIERLLDGAVFVAHNVRFDYAFVKRELARIGVPWSAKCLCTVRLSRALFPRFKHHDLSSLITRHDLSCPSRHRAYDDAYALWQFMEHVISSGRLAHLHEAIERLLAGRTLPPQLETRSLAGLPESPGVYIFYGAEGEPLYVGKSRNIRTRVFSHFTGDWETTKGVALCRQVARIEARPTAGELSALVLESSLIKSMRPMYNRHLVRKKEIVVATRGPREGCAEIRLERVPRIEEYRSVLAIFKSVRQGQEWLSSAAKEHKLCKKLLGLEKGAGECFAYQLGSCLGACRGLEEPHAYNMRIDEAFSARRLKAWPYPSPILVEEESADMRHSFVIDNWCLIADMRASGGEMEFRAKAPEFDLDSYKIFSRYLRQADRRTRIRPLGEQEFRALLSAHGEEEPVIA